jgi:hypothetical protein
MLRLVTTLLMALLAASAALGAATAERIALVVGNAGYPGSPLANPKNDARAVAELLSRAGFQVEVQYDTSRDTLLGSVTRFGQQLRDPGIKLAVFFYAGHGLQLDWRNYLVPVDAKVRSAPDVQRQTVDASELIKFMNESRGRSFVAILDACREDPFPGSYHPQAKGLSPFDAPSGSLLAYSTAPGQVAYDGKGGNSLYTKHLVHELAVPDVSLEDAFKRVRLNVRMESNGRQIPWESTSLEQDVTLFPRRKAALSDAELERRFELELAEWTKVRRSDSINGLTEFIRAFPSGNVSELAQARLNRLLEDELRKADEARREAERQALVQAEVQRLKGDSTSAAVGPADREQLARLAAQAQARRDAAASLSRDPIVPPADSPVPAAPTFVATAAAALPPAAPVAPTPYYQGLSPHRRDYRIGDVLEFRVIDQFSKASAPLKLRVTAVDEAADRVEYNDGEFASDLMGNTLGNLRGDMSTPRQFYPAELLVGKHWRTQFKQARKSGLTYTFRYDVKVTGKETVVVPAGTFEAYRIEARGFNMDLRAQINRTIWVTPGVNADIAHETLVRLNNGRIEQNDRQELVAFTRH